MLKIVCREAASLIAVSLFVTMLLVWARIAEQARAASAPQPGGPIISVR